MMKGKDKAKYRRIRASEMARVTRMADAVHRLAMAYRLDPVAWRRFQEAMKKAQDTCKKLLEKMRKRQ
jgi:hypothetical protein